MLSTLLVANYTPAAATIAASVRLPPCARRLSSTLAPSSSSDGRQRVVVLGAGWAGFQLGRSLDKRRFDVTVVAPRNAWIFTPLLASTAVGTLEFRSITEPIRSIPNIQFFMANARHIDPQRHVVHCESVFDSDDGSHSTFDLTYDKLVVAVGAKVQTFGIPGVGEFAHPGFTFMKELRHARAVRLRLIELCERASEPTVTDAERARLLSLVVVGGGATGVEFTGELTDFVKRDLKRAFPALAPFITITLVEASDQILGSFDSALGAYAKKTLVRRGVRLRTGTKITDVESGVIRSNHGDLPYGLCVWSTGVAPRNFIRHSGLATTPQGRLIVNDHLQSRDHGNIYACGDCAVDPDRPLPTTAQVANQQALYIARSLNTDSPPPPFSFRFMGQLAYVGGNRAITDTPFARWGGVLSWVFWRSVYLTSLVSWSNKFLVPMTWFKTFWFGRDVSSF